MNRISKEDATAMYEPEDIHFTLRNIRRPEVLLPRAPKTVWGYIKWHLMPWTRPPLTPEQRRALKQLD